MEWDTVSLSRILCSSVRLPLKLLILETKALALSGALRRASATRYNFIASWMGSETFQPGGNMFADEVGVKLDYRN